MDGQQPPEQDYAAGYSCRSAMTMLVSVLISGCELVDRNPLDAVVERVRSSQTHTDFSSVSAVVL